MAETGDDEMMMVVWGMEKLCARRQGKFIPSSRGVSRESKKCTGKLGYKVPVSL